MIIPLTKKILIVPDFGVSAEVEPMTALKSAIEGLGRYSVIIADLRKLVLNENQGKELKDSQVIALAAARLDVLASDDTLVWDNCDDYERESAPNVVIVFGKSVMLAGNVREKDILFINPEYDSEWPWRNQYYADCKAAAEYMMRFYDKLSLPIETYVHWDGPEVNRRLEPTKRFGLITNQDCLGQFMEHYPNLGMVDLTVGTDIAKTVAEICNFADGMMTSPMLDIHLMVRDANWQERSMDFCTFTEPVKIAEHTLLRLTYGMPAGPGQTGYKVRTSESDYTIPIETFCHRDELADLKEAISKAIQTLPPRKRILIVPDYFTPYNAPHITELRECLRRMEYYVTVFAAGNTLERSRLGIERRCKKNPFHLVVTFGSGCLLAARITNAPRIFINPEWRAWEWMKQCLGEKKELIETRKNGNYSPFFTYYLNANEVMEARKMGERSYIRRNGKPSVEWSLTDYRSQDLALEIDKYIKAPFPNFC